MTIPPPRPGSASIPNASLKRCSWSTLRSFIALGCLMSCLSACKSKPVPTPNGGVPLSGHSSNGLLLGLRDGSSWKVQPVGQGRTLRWMPGDPILVRRLPHPVFPFQLMNLRTHDATLAAYTGSSGAAR